MVEGERRKRSARLHAESEALSVVLEPLAEMVEALSPRARLSIVIVRNDAFEVAASRGAEPLPVGTLFQSPEMEGFWRRLQDDGSFVFAIDDANVPEGTREALQHFSMQAAFVAWLYSVDHTAECVVIDEPGHRMDFGGRQRRLLSVAVAQAQVARENADLRLAAAKRQRTLEAIARIGVAFTSVLDLKQTADQVVEYASLLLEIPAFVLLFRPEGAADFAVLAAEGLPADISRFRVNPLDLAALDVQQPGGLTRVRLPEGGHDSLFGLLEASGLVNVLVAPLVVGEDKLRGALLALDRRKLEPSEEEREALHLLALQAANAIWNAERYEGEVVARREAKQELETTRLLLDAADALNKWTDLDALLDALANVTLRAISHERVYVGVLAEDRSHVTFASNVGKESIPAGTEVPWDKLSSALREVLETGKTRTIEFETLPEANRGLAASVRSRSALLVPLVFGDRIVGHIAVDDPGECREFTPREIAIVEGIASQAAVAIENARLFEAELEARQQADRELKAAGLSASQARAAEERYRLLFDSMLEGFCTVEMIFDASGNPVDYRFLVVNEVFEKQTGLHDAQGKLMRDLAPDHEAHWFEIYGRVALTGEPVHFTAPADALGRYYEVSAFRVRGPGSHEVGILFNDITERKRAEDEIQERARLSDALNAVDGYVHSTLQSDDVMQYALDEGLRTLGCDAGAIEMLEGDTWVVRQQHGFSASAVGMRLSVSEAPNATRAANGREPFAIEDMTADKALDVGFVRRYGLKSVLAVPLIVKGSVLGCILFYTSTTARRFTSSEIDFGRKLGASVALALENAQLYEEERNVATRLQEALLTLPDSIPGIEFAHAYHSAAEAAFVGGDFYDIFELNHHHVGITIGDIAGKGLDAAVLTSLVKNTIRAHANEKGKTPAQILTLTNDVVFKSTPTESFATVFFAILDCRDGRLVYANAGHTTAAVVRKDGAVCKLSVTGPLLGAFDNARFEQADACLDPDEMLFLYTDGLTEARRDGELYGEERVFAFLSTTGDGSARRVVGEVIGDVTSFSGDRLRDDLALLAVKRLERGAETPMQQKLEM